MPTDVDEDQLSDLAFVLFLDPPPVADNGVAATTTCLDATIVRFSATPVKLHTELAFVDLSAPGQLRVRTFATYYGGASESGTSAGARWQKNLATDDDSHWYYQSLYAGRWRALPLHADDARARAERAATEVEHAPYSLARYVTSTWAFRNLAWLLSDTPKACGHCATIVARVLRIAKLRELAHVDAYYNPSSLYHELVAGYRRAGREARTRALQPRRFDTGRGPRRPMSAAEAAKVVEALLSDACMPPSYGAPADNASAAGDAPEALRSLVAQTIAALQRGDDSNALERELANVLLRLAFLKFPDTRI